MDFTQKIINLIKKAQEVNCAISLSTTIAIAQEYRDITDHPELIDKVLSLILVYDKQKKNIDRLSSRESQIFNLIGMGFTTKVIAKILKISEATVSTHRKNIIKKLQISGVGQLKNVALRYHQE
ncbi:DNA-binding response regulator [Dokdonia sinensis]|uniref:DNA-binding response regulator n=1 Tax=Dokdonia sinensis TaxID=2479847 RepID=A0A3M0G582_9FLAO|nr:LuxR C-terminal-related transcriptional regulator [Dokdonia sinensis]RMB57392.1 DNA-binding response regulator [Dokdonia sinensis]